MSILRRIAWTTPVLVVVLGALPALAGAAPQAEESQREAAPEPGTKGHGKMVFVLTTGLEDLQSVNMAIRHAGMAKKSPGWQFRELPASHHPFVTMPEALTEVLISV